MTMPHTHATTHSSQSSHDHGDPLFAYITVFVCLLLLLLATVGAYYIPFERLGHGQFQFLNTALALTIAFIKSLLVVLVFMHLRHSTRLVWVVAASGFVWLSIMVLFTFADYLSRSAVQEMNMQSNNGATDANSIVEVRNVKQLDTTKGW